MCTPDSVWERKHEHCRGVCGTFGSGGDLGLETGGMVESSRSN